MDKIKILGILEDLNNFMESVFISKKHEILIIKANVYDKLIQRIKREIERD